MFFLADMLNKKLHLPKPGEALPGRSKPVATAARHFVSRRPLKGPYPDGLEIAVLGMGKFWAVERLFWPLQGVWVTAAGYGGGQTRNPTHQEVETGMTGHTEIVRIVFDPKIVSFQTLLGIFWKNHDPTQGMRQGVDVGTLYRSAIYTSSDAQGAAAQASRKAYQAALKKAGLGKITTEIAPDPDFYFAEAHHQQYLAKNPNNGGGLRGTGVAFPSPAGAGME